MHPPVIIANPSPGAKLGSGQLAQQRILLVEDYEPSIVFMKMFLEESGYQCHVVKNGIDALDKFFMFHYDLVIMDLQLPDIDGLETTRRMRLWEKANNLTPTPILSSSGSSSEDDKKFCLKAGMNGCLSKPFQLAEMETKLSELIPPQPYEMASD